MATIAVPSHTERTTRGATSLTHAREHPVSNRLITALPDAERTVLLERCALVELAFDDVLCRQSEPCLYAYFPLTAFISLLASTRGHPPMEVGMIGHEGMLGASLLLGVDLAPHLASVQGPGTALRIDGEALLRVLPRNPVLLQCMQRYYFRLILQVTQTTVCTRFHRVEARLARWLLMSHDRAHADHFHLTHQFLADMLGVQRSAVTIASVAFRRGGLIEYSRGRIDILDRAGLEALACECYAADRGAIPD